MVASLILSITLGAGGGIEGPSCTAREPQLQVVRRPIPVNYPIDDPVRNQAVGVVVIEVAVGANGKAAKVTPICNTAGSRAVKAAVRAARTWVFGAPAHTVGQLEVRFTVES